MEEKALNVENGDEKRPLPKPTKQPWTLTLEPLIFCAILGLTMNFATFPNLFLQRACLVDLNISENICLKTSNVSKQEMNYAESASQKIIASIAVWKSVITSAIVALILMIAGPWSDSRGRRKPLMIIPLIGMIAMHINVLVMLYLPKITTFWLTYAEALPLAMGGSFPLFMMGTFSYLGDFCHKTGRELTSVMGMNTAAMQSAVILGSFGGPLLYRRFGFFTVFSIGLGLLIAALVYAVATVHDMPAKKPRNVSLFCLFRKREGNKRRILWLMVISHITGVAGVGEMSVLYLFFRKKFSWTEVPYGIYFGYKSILGVASTIFIVKVLKEKLSIPNETLGIIGCFSAIVNSFMLMFATNNFWLYLAPIIGVMHCAISVVERPMLVQQIEPNEQGQINATVAIMETLFHLVVVPAYNVLYSRTMDSDPGMFFWVGIASALLRSLCFLASYKRIVSIKFPWRK